MRFVVHVSVVLVRDSQVAMVREGKPGGSYGKWNLPGGHLELGERLVAGAMRELREETGVNCPVTGFLGVYTGLGEHHFLNFVFTASTTNLALRCPDDDVLESKWFSIPELLQLPGDQILNPRKLRKILQDYEARGAGALERIAELMYGGTSELCSHASGPGARKNTE